MKTKFILILILCFTIFNCISAKEKIYKNKVKYVRSNLEFSNKEFKTIKNDSGIIAELYLAIKCSLNKKLIKRRVDSFIVGNYTKSELTSSLELDRAFPNMTIEIVRNVKKEDHPSFDSMESLNEFMRKRKSIEDSLRREFNKKNSKTFIDSSKIKDSL